LPWQGILIEGKPAKLIGMVIKSERYILRGSAVFSPALKAVVESDKPTYQLFQKLDQSLV
jgi:hypothetical protein